MQATLFETDEEAGATFSACRVYRYRLWRRWSDKPLVNWLMLNPSRADEHANDPTVERCERRARSWGYGGIVVTNLFAYRATDPAVMKQALEPVGEGNDAEIRRAATEAGLVVCAWGKDGAHRGRSAEVRALLVAAGVDPYVLRLGKNGEPWHPLYLSYALRPERWAQHEEWARLTERK